MIKKFLKEIRTNDCSKLSESTKYLLLCLISVLGTIYATLAYILVGLIAEKLQANSLITCSMTEDRITA